MHKRRVRFLQERRRSGVFLRAMFLLVTALLWQPRTTAPQPPKTTLDEVSEKLSCRCGCNLVLNRCNHVQCGSAIPMRERINKEMAEGKTRDEIVAGFVRDMGEQVLAVPPTSGFNWNAWIMPFAMLGAGGIGLGIALKVMKRKKSEVAAAAAGVAMIPDRTALENRIEKELKEYGD